uniref:Putative product n=1 Tax=Xenopsylla cheopis TaxID=163159 RepID=A0A6M2E126_XENCH
MLDVLLLIIMLYASVNKVLSVILFRAANYLFHQQLKGSHQLHPASLLLVVKTLNVVKEMVLLLAIAFAVLKEIRLTVFVDADMSVIPIKIATKL